MFSVKRTLLPTNETDWPSRSEQNVVSSLLPFVDASEPFPYTDLTDIPGMAFLDAYVSLFSFQKVAVSRMEPGPSNAAQPAVLEEEEVRPRLRSTKSRQIQVL